MDIKARSYTPNSKSLQNIKKYSSIISDFERLWKNTTLNNIMYISKSPNVIDSIAIYKFYDISDYIGISYGIYDKAMHDLF